MKKLSFLRNPIVVFSLLIAPVFVSCGHDDDKDGREEVPGQSVNPGESVDRLVSKIVVADKYESDVIYFKYDNQNRLIGYGNYDAPKKDVVTYAYQANAVKRTYESNYDEGESGSAWATLDSNHRVVSVEASDCELPEKMVFQYVYDGGYLSKINVGNEFTVNYSWRDGNLCQMREPLSKSSYDLTYGKIKNKGNLDLNWLSLSYGDSVGIFASDSDYSLLGLCGAKSKYMVEKTVAHEERNQDTYFYRYEVDKEGYIQKVIISDTSNESTVFTISYQKI